MGKSSTNCFAHSDHIRLLGRAKGDPESGKASSALLCMRPQTHSQDLQPNRPGCDGIKGDENCGFSSICSGLGGGQDLGGYHEEKIEGWRNKTRIVQLSWPHFDQPSPSLALRAVFVRQAQMCTNTLKIRYYYVIIQKDKNVDGVQDHC